MNIHIRSYTKKDNHALRLCLESLHDYLAEIDDLKRLRRLPELGPVYTRRTLGLVHRNQGAIFFAEAGKRIVGCIVGMIERDTKIDFLQRYPSKSGKILELYVENEYRSRGVGEKLMKRMEEYFIQKGCDASFVEVLACNTAAHRFYQKVGYRDRVIDQIKILK